MNTLAIKECNVDYLDEDASGPTRRLMAACNSAAHRGKVKVGLAEKIRVTSPSHFDTGEDTAVDFVVSISSTGGLMTDRAYYFLFDITVQYDSFGVMFVRCTNGACIVLNNEHDEGTTFIGGGVDFALGRLFRQVVLRDLALIGMGLINEPLELPQSLADWEMKLGLTLDFTHEPEEPHYLDDEGPILSAEEAEAIEAEYGEEDRARSPYND